MLGGGRGRNPMRHTTCNSGHFKHTHNQINPSRHTNCNSGNLLYNTYRQQLDYDIIILQKHHEYVMNLNKFQPKKISGRMRANYLIATKKIK